MPVADLLRQHNISQGTFYRWKSKYGGMDVNEAKRLKALEAENLRLKRLVAEQALDIQILKDVTGTEPMGEASGCKKLSISVDC